MSRLVSALLALLVLLPVSVQAMPDDPATWTVIDSAHFEIYTDAGAERGLEIAQGLEQFWAVFARLAPELELRSPAPTKIFAFKDRQSFGPYKSRADGGGTFLLGQFLAHADGNYLTLDAGTRLVGSLAVVQHELVHYLVRHNFPEAPLWFNEGLAEYYSTFVVEGEVARVGSPIDRHLGWLERRGVDLSTVLAADRRSAAYHEPGQVGGFYAGSWALVHYLLSRLHRAPASSGRFFPGARRGSGSPRGVRAVLRFATLDPGKGIDGLSPHGAADGGDSGGGDRRQGSPRGTSSGSGRCAVPSWRPTAPYGASTEGGRAFPHRLRARS